MAPQIQSPPLSGSGPDRRLCSAEEKQRLLSATRPDWIDVIATAQLTSPGNAPADPGSVETYATIDAQVLVPADADPRLVAFAAACALYNAGTIVFEPAYCSVTVDGRRLRVTLTFDWDTETWFGAVDGRP